MMSRQLILKQIFVRPVTCLVAALGILFSGESAVHAQTYQVLYSFCSQANCADGKMPDSGLVMDQAGNLYGTTYTGRAHDLGTVFELSPGSNGQYTYQLLHSFCALSECADGELPGGPLIVDAAGDVYGTTPYGGGTPEEGGEVYELVPNNGGWTFNILYSFCTGENCPDGNGPSSGLSYAGQSSGSPYDGTSALFGTTSLGGYHHCYNNGCGTVYELQNGANGWSEQVLYAFCPVVQGETCPDGLFPSERPIIDADGNIYGTTDSGGKRMDGVVFALTPTNGSWTETVLHYFCHGSGCPDGSWPEGITENAAADLIGMTIFGGNHNATYCGTRRNTSGCGVAYMIAPNLKKLKKSADTTLYPFCSLAECFDGWQPEGLPLLDAQGDIFDTTWLGGSSGQGNGWGTLFELSGSTLQILYNFCSQWPTCSDGCNPSSGVISDSSGNLYGMALGCGANGWGVVFKITP